MSSPIHLIIMEMWEVSCFSIDANKMSSPRSSFTLYKSFYYFVLFGYLPISVKPWAMCQSIEFSDRVFQTAGLDYDLLLSVQGLDCIFKLLLSLNPRDHRFCHHPNLVITNFSIMLPQMLVGSAILHIQPPLVYCHLSHMFYNRSLFRTWVRH